MTSPLAGGLAKTIGRAMSPLFLDATLTRDGVPTGSSYDPTPGAPQTWPCKAIEDEWSSFVRANGLVAAKDRKVLVLASTLMTEPAEGDRVTIRGVTLTVVADGEGQPAVKSDPALATWELRCRL